MYLKHSKISLLYETTVGTHQIESGFISSCLHLISFLFLNPTNNALPQYNFVLVKELLLSSNLATYYLYHGVTETSFSVGITITRRVVEIPDFYCNPNDEVTP